MVASEQEHSIVAGSHQSGVRAVFEKVTQLIFTCPKSTKETLGKGVNMFKVNSKNTRTMSTGKCLQIKL